MSFGLIYGLSHEGVPGHLRHGQGTRQIRHRVVEHGGVIWRVRDWGLVKLVLLGGHGGSSFVMKVGHQHRSSLEINHTITASLYLFQRCRVQFQVTLGGGSLGRRSLCSRTSFDLADEWCSSIFGMDGPVVSQEQVSSHKGASTFQAFERTLFGVCVPSDELAMLF